MPTGRPRTPATLGFESRLPYVDPVIEAYKKDVDRSLIRAMLEKTPDERLLTLERVVEDTIELRKAMTAATAWGER